MASLSFWGSKRATTDQTATSADNAPASTAAAESESEQQHDQQEQVPASTSDSTGTGITASNGSGGWLSSISSYIGSSIASVASPNAIIDEDDAHLDSNGDLVLPRGEELADIAEGDEDDEGADKVAEDKALPALPPSVTAPAAVVKEVIAPEPAPAPAPAPNAPPKQLQYKTDDKGRKLLIPGPNDPPSFDPLEANRAPREGLTVPVEVTDPLAATQGYSDPAIFPNGSSFTSSNEPLNVIISSKSSPAVLTRKGLQSYLRSLNFDFECLDLHSGGPQYATIDPTGAQAQVFLYREVYTPLDHIAGTCIESLLGGNHIRGYMQAGTNAWFLAVSTEENVTKKHTIIPDGYNIGRDDLVKRSQSQPNGQTDFFFQVWRTSVEYATNLIAAGAIANHDITVDGKTAVLTVTLESTLGVPTVTNPPATAPAPVPAPTPVVASPAAAQGATTEPAAAATTPVDAVPATAGGAISEPAPAPAAVSTAAAEEATTQDATSADGASAAPASRKSTDRARPIKRFSMQLRRRLSGQVSKADADKLLAEVEAAEGKKQPQSRASIATERPASAALEAAAAAAAAAVAPTPAPAPAAEPEADAAQSPTPLELPKLKRRESQLKKVLDRLQPRKPSSSSASPDGGARVASGSSARVVSGALPSAGQK
ncbi:hypothetical protein OC834_004107 [Tilletia horrida]|nr:hypothetical protein OC834_004107 [Tilletia horrida]